VSVALLAPLSVHIDAGELVEKETGRFEVAVAINVVGPAVKVRLAGGLNVIDCESNGL